MGLDWDSRLGKSAGHRSALIGLVDDIEDRHDVSLDLREGMLPNKGFDGGPRAG